MGPQIVYYSTKTGNTRRLVEQLGFPAIQLPLSEKTGESIKVTEDFVLITPTYGGGHIEGSVPKPVKALLNDPSNARRMRAVVACGNRDYGPGFCLSGKIISNHFKVPLLLCVELAGMPADISQIRNGVERLWTPPL